MSLVSESQLCYSQKNTGWKLYVPASVVTTKAPPIGFAFSIGEGRRLGSINIAANPRATTVLLVSDTDEDEVVL